MSRERDAAEERPEVQVVGPPASDPQVVEQQELRCLIVDDESPARDELRFLLDEHGGLQVVGAAATAEEALVLLQNVVYDIVFLDIRMPGISGLELAGRLQQSSNSAQVIFTTAYPDHAVDAFDLSAADYLLKPLSAERLAESISRARSRITSSRRTAAAAPPSERQPLPSDSVTSIQSGPTAHQETRLPVQRGDRTVFVHDRDIVAAAAAHGYSYIYLNSERVLVSYSLTELEQRLPGQLLPGPPLVPGKPESVGGDQARLQGEHWYWSWTTTPAHEYQCLVGKLRSFAAASECDWCCATDCTARSDRSAHQSSPAGSRCCSR